MENTQLTQEMKIHDTIVVTKAVLNDLEISRVLKVARSFVYTFCKKLETSVSKYKIHTI